MVGRRRPSDRGVGELLGVSGAFLLLVLPGNSRTVLLVSVCVLVRHRECGKLFRGSAEFLKEYFGFICSRTRRSSSDLPALAGLYTSTDVSRGQCDVSRRQYSSVASRGMFWTSVPCIRERERNNSVSLSLSLSGVLVSFDGNEFFI